MLWVCGFIFIGGIIAIGLALPSFDWQLAKQAAGLTIHSTYGTTLWAILRDVAVFAYVAGRMRRGGKVVRQYLRQGRYAAEAIAGALVLTFVYHLAITAPHQIEARVETAIWPTHPRLIPPPIADSHTPPTAKARSPFAVVVELRVFSLTDEGYFSGFWFKPNVPLCTISPLNALLFLRVTNLKATKTMITAYRVEAQDESTRGWNVLHAVDLRSGYTLFTEKKEAAGSPSIGNILNLPGKCGYFMSPRVEDVCYQDAAVTDLTLFDDQIGDKQLEPGTSIRGWAAFTYNGKPSMRDHLRITVTDELEQSYSVISGVAFGSKSACLAGNIMPHLIKVVGVANLSDCKQAPAY